MNRHPHRDRELLRRGTVPMIHLSLRGLSTCLTRKPYRQETKTRIMVRLKLSRWSWAAWDLRDSTLGQNAKRKFLPLRSNRDPWRLLVLLGAVFSSHASDHLVFFLYRIKVFLRELCKRDTRLAEICSAYESVPHQVQVSVV